MGKWNNRWIPNQRSYQNRHRGRFQGELPPPYPEESSENSVPEWEKQFCYKVGSVPWRKVLDTKSFASCYPDVMGWDDSQAKETFHNAKRRFWASINGLPTDDFPLPDPDAYIDSIDWDACNDSELYMDLERALLVSDVDAEGETEVGGNGVVDISALTNSKWQEWQHGAADDVWNNGGCWDKSDNVGWAKGDEWDWEPVNSATEGHNVAKSGDNQWECRPAKADGLNWEPVNTATEDHNVPISGDNQWECGPAKTNRPEKNIAWGDSNYQSWGWKQPKHSYLTNKLQDVGNHKEGNFRYRRAAKGNEWAASGNNSWGRNREHNKFRETNAWGHSSIQHNGPSMAREWGRHRDKPRYENPRNNNQHDQTDTYRNSNGNGDLGNRGDRKRESSNNYAPRSKSPRFHHPDNQRHDRHGIDKSWRNDQSMQRTGPSFRPC